MKKVLGFDIKQNGFLNALPNLSSIFFSQFFAVFSDYVRKRQWLSRPASIRVFEAIGMLVPSVGCLAMAFSLSDWRLVILVLCLPLGFRGAIYSGRNLVPFDVTPAYAGPTFGFINMIGQSAGFVTPLLTAALTSGDPTDPSGWQYLFYIAAGLMTVPFFVFLFFAKFDPVEFDDKKKDGRSCSDVEQQQQQQQKRTISDQDPSDTYAVDIVAAATASRSRTNSNTEYGSIPT